MTSSSPALVAIAPDMDARIFTHHASEDPKIQHLKLQPVPGEARGDRGSRRAGGDCVEIAPTPDAVLVRDSKHRPSPALTVLSEAWQAFLTTVTR